MTGTPTQGIKTVLHPVSDLAAAKPVYTALLGTEPQHDAEYYVGFDVEGQHIGLVPGGGEQGMTSPVAYWHVADIEALARRGNRGRRQREGGAARGRLGSRRGQLHRRGRERPRPDPGPLSGDRRQAADEEGSTLGGRRRARSDPRPRRAREQPQRRERRAAEAARRRAQTRDDFDRRSRRRPRPRRRQCRRRSGVRGYGRGPAGQRHDHGAAFSRTGRLSRTPCGRAPGRSRSAVRAPTTSRTSMSTSRSACWSS